MINYFVAPVCASSSIILPLLSFQLFQVAVDKVLWEVFCWLFRVLFWLISVPRYDLLPLTAVADMFHDMVDSVFPWLIFSGSLPQLVISSFWGCCKVCAIMASVVCRRQCRLAVAYCPALTLHGLKILCSIFRPSQFLWCALSSRWRISVQGGMEVLWGTLPRPFCMQQM